MSVNANTVEEYLAPLKEMFAKYVPAEEVACIVVETIQGDGGLLEPVDGYFEALEALCREHGILIVRRYSTGVRANWYMEFN